MTQVNDQSYALIDYEHGGEANQAAPFQLRHWPSECQAPGAPYTPGADVYGVGWVMCHLQCLVLDAEAQEFCDQLMAPLIDRPSAAAALQLPWLACR